MNIFLKQYALFLITFAILANECVKKKQKKIEHFISILNSYVHLFIILLCNNKNKLYFS